jgi:LemA protein
MEALWIIIGIVVVVGIWVIGLRNTFVRLSIDIEEGMASIDNQLKRRYDLIPNLVNTVKGYAKHEKELLDSISKARAGLISPNIDEKMAATSQTSGLLNRLLAVAEAYPDLKANTSFEKLQVELVGTEDKISYARQFYNGKVGIFNKKILMFPSNIVASMFGFTKQAFFEVDEVEKQNVKVEF